MDTPRVTELDRSTRVTHPVAAALLLLMLSLTACTSTPAAGRQGGPNQPAAAVSQPVATSSSRPTCRTTAMHQQRFRLRSAGVVRSYLLSVGAGVGPRPLVVVFHGFDQNGQWMDRYTQLPRDGAAAGFAVATPDGYAERWNFPRRRSVGPDDVRFVRDMVGAIGEKLCLDRRNVFVTGFSDGADMADTVACADPQIRAVAGVAASVPVHACSHRVDVLQIHGDADPVVPFEGGGGDRPPPFQGEEAVSVDAQMTAWRAVNGCSVSRAARTRLPGGIIEIRALGCASRRSVLLIVVPRGGHTWPGATFALPYGATNHALSATTRVLYFFRRLVRA